MTGCVQRLQLLNEVKRCSLSNNSGDDHIFIQSTLTLLHWRLETDSDHKNIRIDFNTAELANENLERVKVFLPAGVSAMLSTILCYA
jgi:hypothetical protein